MNRELTTREKTLLLILCVLVISLGYFKLILEPINDQVLACRTQTEEEQTELTQDLLRVAQMRKMEKTVAEIKASGEEKTIPSYDNSGRLLQELYHVMENAEEYSLDFSAGVTQEDYIVLRPVTLSFQTGSYAQARAIIDALSESENLNQISDLSIQSGQGDGRNKVQTELVITYFEVAS